MIAKAYKTSTSRTVGLFCGKLRITTVLTSFPNAAYDKTPIEVNNIVMNTITPVNTFGNFSGSLIDSVIGMICECECECEWDWEKWFALYYYYHKIKIDQHN